MRIKIINPNTTATFTELSLNAGRAVAAPGTEILAGQPSSVTPSVECHVDAASEVAAGPVVGMTEAALYAAALIAPVFSIVTLPRRTRMFAERAVWHAGLDRRCARIRAIDVDVQDLEDETSKVFDAFVAEAARAIEEDHAEAIILGCAGLEPLLGPLVETLGVPVIEGVAAAVKMVEALLAMRLTTSKAGAWGYPLQKPITGPAASLVSPTRDRT